MGLEKLYQFKSVCVWGGGESCIIGFPVTVMNNEIKVLKPRFIKTYLYEQFFYYFIQTCTF